MLFVDQYNTMITARTVKELCAKIGYARGSARRMYVDRKDGRTVHVGYVLGRHWFTMFQRVENEV